MKRIKKLFFPIIVSVSGLFIVAVLTYFTVYDSYYDFQKDFDSTKRVVWLELFNRGYIEDLSQEDIRYVYQNKCYRRCHGDAAMITAVLSPAGWFQIVERMRVQEKVDIHGREADVIVKYLEETYPTVQSKYSYEVRKETHSAVWRNDMGLKDVYTDIIYATPEYLTSIGAEHLIDEYDLENYDVFIISFSVHEGELKIMDLDKMVFLYRSNHPISTTPPWQLRFQTADKHHLEATVKFAKEYTSTVANDTNTRLKLIVKGVRGSEDRVFRWNVPIVYPKEFVDYKGAVGR